jgi:hypothetical protein
MFFLPRNWDAAQNWEDIARNSDAIYKDSNRAEFSPKLLAYR